MRKALFIIFILIGWKVSFSQCSGVTITPNKPSYCAGEPVTIKINNPRANTNYRMIIAGVTYNDTIAVVGFPGASVSTDYFIDVQYNLLGSWVSCVLFPPSRPKVTVSPSPDPTIKDISANQSSGGFKQCITALNYQLDIQNASSTAGTYTQTYTIDWGDGSAVIGPTTNFTTLSHTYNSPGGYTLTYTVTANELTGTCKTVTKTYEVYFGVLPSIGIGVLDPTILCAPQIGEYIISLADNNSPGTTYSVSVGNLVAANFAQPPPSQFNYLFEESSCGKTCSAGGSGGSSDRYEIRVTAKNLCGQSTAAVCQPVADSVEPIIISPDTVCVNVPATFTNPDVKSRIFINGKCEMAYHTWNIIPSSGFTTPTSPALNIPIQRNNLNVTFTQTGHYRITLRDSGYCNTKDTFKDIVVVDRVYAQAAFLSNSCMPSAGFVDVPMTNTSGAIADIVKYTWVISPPTGTSFVVGNSNSISPTIRFTNSGSYNIKLNIEGGCNTDSWDSTIVIKGKPSIDTLPIPQGCFVPHTINPKNYFNYTNGGDANAIFNWSFPGGNPTSSNTEDPGNVTYNNDGTFAIGLHITAECGDSILTNFITVNNNIKPNAGPDFGVCKFDPPITLSAVPAGGVWRGNGITDSILGIFRPSSVVTGTHTIVYVLNPTGSCPTTDTLKITVSEIVGLTAGADQSICKGSGTLQLIGNPQFPNGNWIGTGVVNSTLGIFDPTGIIPGNYQVGYVFTDSLGACKDTAYKRVTVFDSIQVSTPPDLCVNQAYNFGNIVGNLTSAVWDFGDNTPNAVIINPSHTYSSAGNFTITLIGETADRCKDTILIPITVVQNPPLSFIIIPDSSCTGNNITFSFPANHDTTNNYIWNFGISNATSTTPISQTVSFPKPLLRDTLYFVRLRADYYCGPSYYTDTVKVKASPKADFGIQPIGCSPFTPTLANTSYGSPTNFLWNFGNGQTTTIQNPTAPTYINTTRRDTTYKISLFVSNACGTDTITKSITVKGNDVTAKFFSNITQGCQPLTVDFYNISTPGTEIIWDFGDGTSAYADQVSHVYDSAGIFRVKLLAIGDCGRDSFITTVNVFAKPNPGFNVLTPCVNMNTQFVNTTTNGNSFVWDFGDGTTSTQPNPNHVYTAEGVYTVKLIVANSRPCVDSISKQVSVTTKPTAAFNVVTPKVCEQEPTVFLNESVDANNYLWYLGNGITSTLGGLTYIYPSAGNYNVTLTAINGNCRDSITKVAAVEIYPKPIADFLYEFTGDGFNAPIEFTNITANGNVYFWNFGDSDTSDLKDPTHQYNGEGPYRVTLFATSSKGCKDTISYALGVDYDGQLYVPNVFSPETGIGEAAVWKPKGLALKEYHVQVFSTYGQLLWESTRLENEQPVDAWDGRVNGKILPQDVYVWKIRAIFSNGKSWEGMKDSKTGKRAIMGSIVLLR